MFVLLQVCDKNGFFATELFEVQQEQLEKLWTVNDTFFFNRPALRHYVATQRDIGDQHVQIDCPISEFNSKTRIMNGEILRFFTWGSSINYKRCGFVIFMLYNSLKIENPDLKQVYKFNQFKKYFENWETDEDEDEQKRDQ